MNHLVWSTAVMSMVQMKDSSKMINGYMSLTKATLQIRENWLGFEWEGNGLYQFYLSKMLHMNKYL